MLKTNRDRMMFTANWTCPSRHGESAYHNFCFFILMVKMRLNANMFKVFFRSILSTTRTQICASSKLHKLTSLSDSPFQNAKSAIPSPTDYKVHSNGQCTALDFCRANHANLTRTTQKRFKNKTGFILACTSMPLFN